MADFSNTSINPIQGGETVKAGVSSTPTTYPSPDLFTTLSSTITDTASWAMKAGESLFENQKKTADSKLLADFTSNQLRIIDGHSQGSFSMGRAQAMLRSNISKYIAANPTLGEQILKRNGELISNSGLGQDVIGGTPQEKAQREAQDQAMKAGWLQPNLVGTPEADNVVRQFQEFKLSGEQLQRSTDIITNATKQIEYGNAQTTAQKNKIELATTVNRYKADQALANMAGAFSDNMSVRLGDIKKQFDSGQIDGVTAQHLTNQAFSGFSSTVNQVGAWGSAESKSGIIRPIEDMRTHFNNYFSGKTTSEYLTNSVQSSVAKSQLAALHDPEVQQYVGLSKLFDGNLSLDVLSNKLTTRMLADNASPNSRPSVLALPKGATEEKAAKSGFDLLKHNIDILTSENPAYKDSNVERAKEVYNQINNTFRGINAYSSSVDRPTEYNQVVDFLASPAFGKYATKVGGIPVDSAPAVKNVLDQQYRDVVIPLMQQKYTQATGIQLSTPEGGTPFDMAVAMTPDTTQYSVKSNISPVFDGTGVRFTINQGVKDPSGSISSSAASLNTEVAPILNRLIRMDAHLNGTIDYRKSWEDKFINVFLPKQQSENIDANKQAN